MSYVSHSPWLNHSNYIWRRVQVMKLLIVQFSPTSNYFVPLHPRYSRQYLVLTISSLFSPDILVSTFSQFRPSSGQIFSSVPCSHILQCIYVDLLLVRIETPVSYCCVIKCAGVTV
jgi:hypothetical protein